MYLVGDLVRAALVSAELSSSSKALAAHGALERALRLVQPAVIAKVSGVGELLPAVGAGVVLVAAVGNSHVLLHVVQAGERFAAVRTEDAALMHPPMVGVLPAGVHLLAAQLAPIQHLSGVQALVFRQIAADRELFPALVALVRFFAGVGSSVFGHGIAADELLAADVADVRLLARMRPVVVDVLAEPPKRLATVLEVAHVDHLLPDGPRRPTPTFLDLGRHRQLNVRIGGGFGGQVLFAYDDALQQHLLQKSLFILADQRSFRFDDGVHTVQVGTGCKYGSVDLERLSGWLHCVRTKTDGGLRHLMLLYHSLFPIVFNSTARVRVRFV